MVPQLSEKALTIPRVVAESTAPLFGLANGRPPDITIPIQFLISLEREDHPINEEDQQVSKKSMGEGDEVMDVGGGGFNGLTKESVVLNGDDVMVCDGVALEGGGELVKSDPIDKFGPWMQATSRRARKGSTDKTLQNSGYKHRGAAMSVPTSGKFSALENLDKELEYFQEPVVEADGTGMSSEAVTNSRNSSGDANISTTHISSVRVVAPETHTGDSHVEILHGSSSGEKELNVAEHVALERVEVASSEKVVQARVSLDPKAHMTVRVLDSGKEKVQASVLKVDRQGKRILYFF
ncbi:hypothetical protein V6N11_035887 [Hibiscus sabdariffa]|uniref:Uncharacterized protein n=1 Tax=Hibiscus sabdariffa TaxID=183260 RepID=A0ABR2R8U8_9ROSI